MLCSASSLNEQVIVLKRHWPLIWGWCWGLREGTYEWITDTAGNRCMRADPSCLILMLVPHAVNIVLPSTRRLFFFQWMHNWCCCVCASRNLELWPLCNEHLQTSDNWTEIYTCGALIALDLCCSTEKNRVVLVANCKFTTSRINLC